METQTPQALYAQISDYIDKSRKILIALPTAVTVDRLCGAYALHAILNKLGKEVTLASSASFLPAVGFLYNIPEITSVLSADRTTIIQVATAHAELDELSYHSDEAGVKIFLKPKDGQFLPEDVSVSYNTEPYDLVITIGAHALEDLGNLYTENSPLFFEKPKINIDDDPSNEYFGTVNVVDVTAAAVSEVVYNIVEAIESAVTDEHVATGLLGGIISNTHSFQDPSTTPQTFTAASALIVDGARQQDVIQHLFKTKEFSLLKLWGRALARIKTDHSHSLLYSQLTISDFEKTGETIERMPDVMRELLENVSGFQLVALMGEAETGTRLLLAGLPHVQLEKTAAKISQTFTPPINIFGLYQLVAIDLPGVAMFEVENLLVSATQTS